MFKTLSLLFLVGASQASAAKTDDAKTWATAHAVEIAFAEDQGWDELGQAIGHIMDISQWELKRRGHEQKALEIGAQWEHFHALYFELDGPYGDIGDHKPLSDWLTKVYQDLVDLLGQKICDMLHITDIEVINFGIPVVFSPKDLSPWCLETLRDNPKDNCQDEYSRHFTGTKWQKDPDQYAKWQHTGLVPVITYWIAWGTCEAATYGGGYVLICTPIGDACEFVMERYIAPTLSDKIYLKANQ